MSTAGYILLTSTLLLFQHVSAAIHQGNRAFSAQLANHLENSSQGFKKFNWSTAVPDPGPLVVANGVELPPKVLVMPYEGSAEATWAPGTFFTWDQWNAISAQNYTDHEREVLAKRYSDSYNLYPSSLH